MAEREKAYVVSVESVANPAALSPDFLTTVIESSYDGIYITDGNANTIMINKSYENISGLNRRRMLGRNMRELVRDGVISRSGTLAALEQGTSVTLEQSFETGKRAVITSTPIFNQSGEIVMVLTNVRDVTDLRSLEEKLEDTRDQNHIFMSELENLRRQMGTPKQIIAVDSAMQEVIRIANRVAGLDATVLLVGESGVGKRELARYIVSKSRRKKERYVMINCAAGHESLEKEIFGCAPGVDPSAPEGKKGMLELAANGTVLLDTVSELPMDLQMRVSNFLQTHRLRRLGASEAETLNVRVLATTTQNLKKMVEEHRFREDLYYQLDVLPIHMLPLRERREDILPILDELVTELNKKYHQKKRFTQAALLGMRNYDWPGNLRELRNVVERVMIMCPSDTIDLSDLPIQGSVDVTEQDISDFGGTVDLQRKLDELELAYIQEAYQKHGNVRAAAKSLGMDPSTYVRRRKKLEKLKLLQE